VLYVLYSCLPKQDPNITSNATENANGIRDAIEDGAKPNPAVANSTTVGIATSDHRLLNHTTPGTTVRSIALVHVHVCLSDDYRIVAGAKRNSVVTS
jgi:hypothetical protein